MTRFEALMKCADVYQLVSFLERHGNVCAVKANTENWKKWCRQYRGIGGCDKCKVDYWNEELADVERV